MVNISNAMGALRIRIKRGIDLAIRDATSSDPYVIVLLDQQKLKTRTIKKSLNPVWDEDLTLCVTNPNEPLKLFVYDYDIFSPDDRMGEAEIDLRPFLEVVKWNLKGVSNGTIVTQVKPNRHNCIAEDSPIVFSDGKVTQNIFLRLRNVESGEIELQLNWIDLPTSRVA
ncbi:hypothetical protein BVRB_2g039530 [Beta vulgaris subsp. vulgaris]|uniref:protein C2-DOMAIN ABA-RELATED 1 n=1 Tax=Beta vulgaris subsp. vulgaris TaxID=3555 RepID=UPI0005402EB1|nr:protein C2-DOMAIN ABA-RELATED 1 [Beta vulgaris subsp. vulgaris]KMT17253.1 hypothetical protein BVRB_2g039530 [Beta vulgaris subsp. vulgaris]